MVEGINIKNLTYLMYLMACLLLISSGSAFAQNGNPNGPPGKVDICHIDEEGTFHLINISERAVPAHEAHGDAFPDANGNCPPFPLAGFGVVNSSSLDFSDGGFGGWSVPADTVVLGGGFELTGGPASVSAPGQPNEVWPHHTFGSDEYGWVVQDTSDGSPSPGSTVYAIHASEPAGYEIVTSSALAFSDGGFGGWSCPAGKVVLGGGFESTGPVSVSAPGQPNEVWPHHTFGSDEYGWVVQDAPDGTGNTITIYAICVDEPAGYQIVDSGPLAFSDTGFGGWSCPAGTVVTGGGFDSTGTVSVSAPGQPGDVWPHYTFGPDEYGWVVRDAPDGSGNTTTVYAVCASE